VSQNFAVEFRGDLWHQKTKVPECGVVRVILRLAVLVELRLVTDEQTDGRTLMQWRTRLEGEQRQSNERADC